MIFHTNKLKNSKDGVIQHSKGNDGQIDEEDDNALQMNNSLESLERRVAKSDILLNKPHFFLTHFINILNNLTSLSQQVKPWPCLSTQELTENSKMDYLNNWAEFFKP